jgi:hypothetical protein
MVLIGELLQKRKQEASQSNDAVSLGVDKKPLMMCQSRESNGNFL